MHADRPRVRPICRTLETLVFIVALARISNYSLLVSQLNFSTSKIYSGQNTDQGANAQNEFSSIKIQRRAGARVVDPEPA